ncbi:Gmad2 immunoglobulin-like domain-containing protein [Nocardioides sp. GXZ039]|uniref:Gmad2 immunoglobulin-like domain-containing protein n=1 Tax=Nocardioides sp. GXZ039 TaxID=3136018 RepID=UPI0030F38313
MNAPDHLDDLRALLGDAVADVEPTDRLAEIRSRTSAYDSRRRGWYAAGGVALATAAAITAFAVLSPGDSGSPHDPATSSTAPAVPTQAVGLYFIGDTPQGPRLFREFRQIPRFDPAGDILPALDALDHADDPDYRTAWPERSILSAQVDGGGVRVELGPNAPSDDLALQQLRATVAGVTGLQDITLDRDGTTSAVEQDFADLSPVSISDPTEGRTVSGSFTARGVANTFEGTVGWQIRDSAGDVVEEYSATAEGSGGERLYPWETEVDVSDLTPGTYTFAAIEDSGDPEYRPIEDTRTIVVEAPSSSPAATDPPSSPSDASGVVAWYVGPAPTGPDVPFGALLYPETTELDDPVAALLAEPGDPDYRTLWPAGSLIGIGDPEGGVSVVEVSAAALRRPSGMTDGEATLAIQQVVQTVRSYYGDESDVAFVGPDGPVDTVLGTDVGTRISAASDLVSLMQIHTPVEGATAHDTLAVTGVGLGFEGTVACSLAAPGGAVVWEDATIAGSFAESTPQPWRFDVDVSGIAPGDYDLTCATDDPAGGSEGRGSDVDTRGITLE